MERIGAVESAECWWCGDREQSVLYLYTNYQRWRRERRVLKEFGKVGGPVGETIKKEIVSRAASKRAGDKTVIGVFERYGSG